jgi:hypothetical protein
MSIIFVGEVTNPPGLPPEEALTGDSGHHLAELAGLDYEVYLSFARYNVDETGHDDKPTRREHARRIEEDTSQGDAIVMLGRSVQSAFGFGGDLLPFSRAVSAMGVALIAFPHPSKTNRFWNDPGSEDQASLYLRDLMTEFDG